MVEYAAPLRDIRFILQHQVDLAALAALPGLENAEPDLVDAILEEAARLARDVVGPTNVAGDRHGAKFENGSVTTAPGFREAYKQFCAGGWNGVPFDPAFGGGGLPWAVSMAVQEMITSANMAFSLCPLLTQGAVEALSVHGTPEQQALYLGKLVTGEWTGTMNLTEPQAGSDVGALKTRAAPGPDGTWLITGSKIFITFGEHDMTDNIIHFVLARTPGSPPGTKGISLFIVPKFLVNADGSLGARNDLRCVSIEHKLGIHGSPTCVMSYGDNGGATGWLLGSENQGMRCMFTMMNNARLSVGLQGLAIAERAYQQALAFAGERRQSRPAGVSPAESTAIIEHPDVRRNLLLMKSQIEAMRALIYLNAEALDIARHHPDAAVRQAKQNLAELLTPVSKAWATDLGVEIASLGIQIHGGMGFIEETGAAQHLRDARIAPIYEGTNGIQALDLVGRKLPLAGGAVVRDFIAEMQALDLPLEGAGPELAALRIHLASGCAALSHATDWMLKTLPGSPNLAAAGATPYLRLLATVIGGWLLGRQALIAGHALTEAPDPFLAGKLLTARFYADQVLPQAVALLPAVIAGATDVTAITAEMLGNPG